MDGREPGTGTYDCPAILDALQAIKYSGWVSLEVFDLSRDGTEVARNAINFLKKNNEREALTQSV